MTDFYLRHHPDMVALLADQADEFHALAEKHSLEILGMQKRIRRLAREEEETQ